jgi:malic enzyme
MLIAGAEALATHTVRQNPGQLLPPISALPVAADTVSRAVAATAAQEKAAHPHFRPDLFDPREDWWEPQYRDYLPMSD